MVNSRPSLSVVNQLILTRQAPLTPMPYNDKDSSNKILFSPDCILRRFPPEIRKCIFRAVVDLFFHDQPKYYERLCPSTIRYTINSSGKAVIGPYKEAPEGRSSFRCVPKCKRIFAGLWESLLPALEVALLADTEIHGEFITTRIEESTLVLAPGVPYLRYWGEHPIESDYVVWPRVEDISAKVRESVRAVVYNLE